MPGYSAGASRGYAASDPYEVGFIAAHTRPLVGKVWRNWSRRSGHGVELLGKVSDRWQRRPLVEPSSHIPQERQVAGRARLADPL